MARRLSTADAGFAAAFEALLGEKREADEDVAATASAIVADVRARGDAALVDYTRRFDRFDLTPEAIRIPPAEIAAAAARCAPATIAALRLAAERIEAFHRAQMPAGVDRVDAAGVRTGLLWRAIQSVGIYVPGGLAAYPSSVLMNAMPAKVAGVERVVMAVPTPDGVLNPLVLAAAHLAGVAEIHRVGGAQAIGALAYGTASIRPVDKVVGPGNAYVAAAKRQVFGIVGIDMIAGPSEIVVVSDGGSDPDWIAADLLSQAEHDSAAQSILLTDDAAFADRVAAAVEAQLARLPRKEIAGESWRQFGAVILLRSLDEAPPLVDRLAPEHLEVALADPEPLGRRFRNVGSLFLGRHTPEAIGDYVAGPNHVLPTARSARFSSGLGVHDFLKRTTFIACDAASLARIGPAAIALAEAEGLDAHARSVAIRLAAPA